MSLNSFNSRSTLKVGNKEYEIYRLDALDKQGISTRHLPIRCASYSKISSAPKTAAT